MAEESAREELSFKLWLVSSHGVFSKLLKTER